MTEEENKAIEYLQAYIKILNKAIDGDIDYTEVEPIQKRVKYLETIKNLIEKLKKENEDREQAHMKLYNEFRQYKDWDSIPKYKIRDFIKRLEKDVKNIREKKKDSHDYDRSSTRIQAYLTKTNEIIKRLKKLLEDENILVTGETIEE